MADKTYRAAIYRGIRSVEMTELAYPVCGDDDAIVRNLITGVCGSDVSAYFHGGDDNMIWSDHEFGHEVLSEVAEVGANVRDLQVGDRVFVNQGFALRDMSRMATVGGFSEYIRIPRCEVGYSVLKIGPDIPAETAVLFEPFTVGARAVKNIDVSANRTAIVFGAGIIGVAAAIMLRWYGCDKVMMVDLSDFRLEKAADLGFVTCNPATDDVSRKAIEEFGAVQGFFGENCSVDLYLDAAGVGAVVDQFRAIASQGATLAIVGIHHRPYPFDLAEICTRNWRVQGCGDTPSTELAEDILAMMRSGRFDLPSLVTHVFDLDDISAAIEKAADTDNAQKVCVRF